MYLSSFCLAGILASAASFSTHRLNNLGVPVSRRIQHKSSRTDQGWNNDNFLDSLSGGRAARETANQQYYLESANRAAMRDRRLQSMAGKGFDDPSAAAIFGGKVSGMPDKPPKAPPIDEENPMGGQMFKKMMEKAKNGPNRPVGQYFSEMPSQTPGGNVIPPAPTTAAVAANDASRLYSAPQTTVDPMAYYQQQLQAWQQQVTAFAQLSALNPEAASKITMPPPPPPPPFMNVGTAPAVPQSEPQYTPPPKPDLERRPEEVNPLDYVPRGSGNKDAYEITNPADVYFAQLKRDSYVRTVARRNGDIETANKPFADVGVKALSNLLSPELIAQRREQLRANGGEFETSRDEMIIPYEEEEEDVDRTYTGISYKQKIMEMKKKKSGVTQDVARISEPVVEKSVPASAPASSPTPETMAVSNMVDSVQESTVFAPVSAPAPAPAPTISLRQVEKGMDGKEKSDFALDIPESFDDAPVPAPSAEDTEETRKKIRTLMGFILKHRGGPGFGHGRLQKEEAMKLTESVQEVMALLKSEAGMEVSVPSSTRNAVQDTNIEPTSPPRGRVAEAIACAEAAINMYKNLDSASQKELLVPVRDALASTVKVISKVIEESSSNNMEEPLPQKPVYATTMEFPETYKVTRPDEELESRTESDGSQDTQQILASTVADQKSNFVATGERDYNTQVLEEVYNSLKSVAGDEKYGLREIGSDEVTHIKDVLKNMRSILMDELDNGIPEE